MGTTLALMMSVAALSLPEMLILRNVVQWQALALSAGSGVRKTGMLWLSEAKR